MSAYFYSDDSKRQTYNRQVRFSKLYSQQGGTRLSGWLTAQIAKEKNDFRILSSIKSIKHMLNVFSTRTNKRNRSLTERREKHFVPGYSTVDLVFFVTVSLVFARHVQVQRKPSAISALVEWKTKIYNRRFGSALRTPGKRGAAVPCSMSQVANKPTVPLALVGIVDNCLKRPFARKNKKKSYLLNPKPGHTMGRSGRGGARRGGGAGRGWLGLGAVGSIRPGDNPPSCHPANRELCPQ